MADVQNKTSKRNFWAGSSGAIALIVSLILAHTKWGSALFAPTPSWPPNGVSNLDPTSAHAGAMLRGLRGTVADQNGVCRQQSAEARARLLELTMVGMRLQVANRLAEESADNAVKMQDFAERELFPRARKIAEEYVARLWDTDVELLLKPLDRLSESEAARVARLNLDFVSTVDREMRAVFAWPTTPVEKATQ